MRVLVVSISCDKVPSRCESKLNEVCGESKERKPIVIDTPIVGVMD